MLLSVFLYSSVYKSNKTPYYYYRLQRCHHWIWKISISPILIQWWIETSTFDSVTVRVLETRFHWKPPLFFIPSWERDTASHVRWVLWTMSCLWDFPSSEPETGCLAVKLLKSKAVEVWEQIITKSCGWSWPASQEVPEVIHLPLSCMLDSSYTAWSLLVDSSLSTLVKFEHGDCLNS